MQIGIDLGGTKIEVIALEGKRTLLRQRIPTPKGDYAATLQAITDLVAKAEADIGGVGTVGVGIPGTISPATGLVKNANSTWLNGKPLLADLQLKLAREVRVQNDANCFAVSESLDGAGQGFPVVAGIILGTGCGCGIAIEGKALVGRRGIAGEFGHTPLPSMTLDEMERKPCWCGRRGCLETFVSGTGFQCDYALRAGDEADLRAEEILSLGTEPAAQAFSAYCDRLARGLSLLVNIIDPDILVLGGGMSNAEALYESLPGMMTKHIFSDVFDTPIVRAAHGDSSGVRGAAKLW